MLSGIDTLPYKIVVLGDAAVGKTTLLSRWVQNRVDPNPAPTIGVSFFPTTMQIEGKDLQLQFWDTAGQETYRSSSPMYCRNARAAMLVYDITKKDSFDHLPDWVTVLHDVVADAPFIVVGNKLDIAARRQVEHEDAFDWAHGMGARLYEVSAVKNMFVDEAFTDVAITAVSSSAAAEPPVSLLSEGPEKKSCC